MIATLKEFGKFILKGTKRAVKEIKVFVSKHMCLEAPESIIYVLELKTEKRVL